MERSNPRDDVAVFIDFENVYVSVREKFDATPNFELIMDRCEDYGRIVLARAYADWYRYPRVTSALFANGVEPMYVPTYYYDREIGRTGRPIKNSVDIHLCIDAMRTLYTQAHIDKFVLVTGDRDFIPLVNAIRQHGKDVIIIGIGGAASAHLAQSGDEFLFYEQIADLKTPEQRQAQQKQERSERRERDRPEKSDRGDRERSEGNGKVERRERDRAEAKQERQPEVPQPEVEAPAPPRTPFDTLVDAINLARQRGFVSNLGSLKVLMRELDSNFHESKAKDASGRPFVKFKDFVKEAERQGKVQVFTNGTVTEVFLAGENPMVVSQFAEELASQQAERELENELAAQEAQGAEADVPEADAPEVAEEPAEEAAESNVVEAEQPPLPELPDAPEPVVITAEAPAVEAAVGEETTPTRTFNDREMMTFRGAMSQFTDPVRFAEIFSALRGLRNQEVFDLTNNELKDLVKQAINSGMLQRTGRGARAYYRLSSQYRIAQDDAHPQRSDEQPTEMPEQRVDEAAEVESAAGLVSDAGLAPAAQRRRRGRSYTVVAPATDAPAEPQTGTGAADAIMSSPPPNVNDTLSEQMAVQTAEEVPAKPRRNRRRKPAATEAAAPEATAPEAPASEAQPEAAPEAPTNGNGTKKRRTRRKKTPDQNDANTETAGE